MTFHQDPAQGPALARFKASCVVVYVLSALNFAAGLYALSQPRSQVGRMLGDGRVLMAVGLVFAILGIMAQRKSVAALAIAFGLVVINMVANLVRHFNPGSIIFGSLIAWALWSGVTGLREINRAESPPPR